MEGHTAGRWARAHYFPLRGGGDEVVGVLVVTVDVQQLKDAEAALADRERQLSLIMDSVGFPVTYVDRERVIRFANRPSREWSGRTSETMIGRDIAEVMTPEVAASAARLRRGDTCTHERLVGPPGEEPRWHLVQLAPIMVALEDGAPRFNGYYIVSSDIHDIKLAQERLAAQEAQLRLYTDNIPDSVAYLDRSRTILFANRHFAELRGLKPEDIVGRTTAQVLGAETAAWIAERTQKVFDRGETATYERLITMPDGEKRWFHVKAVPNLDSAGAVVGMYVVSHDINDVKQAQEQLAAREEEMRFFAENIPEAIAYIDVERGCTFVNNVFLASRGFTREFALGRFPEEAYEPDVMEELRPHLARGPRGEETSYERVVRVRSA